MKILFVASEAAPFAKTGGLADVVGSLPKELRRRGHDVRIIIPHHRGVVAEGATVAAGLPLPIVTGSLATKATLAETIVDGVPVYLLGNDYYFDRDFLYGTPAGDYPDNHRRYAFFCRAVLATMAQVGFCPDIFHCHDWQTALLPVLARHEPETFAPFPEVRVIYTIHNLAYQGIFPLASIPEMGLSRDLFREDQLEYYGMVNLMKGGILNADGITTVSPTYRRETLESAQGCGLEGVLQKRRDDYSGILNGLDYGEWNPETDQHIFGTYSAASPEDKGANKIGLQRMLGLETDASVPVVGIVSRLVAQKGLDLVIDLLPRLAKEPLQVVILGSGDEKYIRLLQEFKGGDFTNISINIGFASWLAPKIYAGSDIFLMPSQFEPCGLGQLIALRYGAVPVVRKTGGLADTVIDPNDAPENCTGFTFSDYTPAALWKTLERALIAFREKKSWRQLMERGMAADFSWEQSAAGYEEIYRSVMKKARR